MSRLFSLTAGAALAAVTFLLPGLVAARLKPAGPAILRELSLYAGSKSCIECHKIFYRLWATSRHGLAMQPFTPEFARANLTPPTKYLVIGKYRCRADIRPQAGDLLRQALKVENLPPRERARVSAALQRLSHPESPQDPKPGNR